MQRIVLIREVGEGGVQFHAPAAGLGQLFRGTPLVFCSSQSSFADFTRVLLIIIAIVQVDLFHVCECAIGVDVRDGTIIVLISIP